MSTLNGKLKVKQNGQYVVIHPETESSLITDFANAVTNTIPITTRANNAAYKVGDCVFVKGLPSWAYLECTQAGTTAATAPSTITTTVTLDTAITDGTAKWIVRQYGLPSNPALRSIINNKIAADSLLYGSGANTFAITALSSLARTLIGKTTPADMRSVIGARENKELTSGDIQNFATEVISAIGAQTLSALGVKYSMTENGYICFGQLFGGLILQWKFCEINTKVVYPIAKKNVIGVTKANDALAVDIRQAIKDKRPTDLSPWCLSKDDYILALNVYNQSSVTESDFDFDYFLFICY